MNQMQILILPFELAMAARTCLNVLADCSPICLHELVQLGQSLALCTYVHTRV